MSVKIYENVVIPTDAIIEDGVQIGVPPHGKKAGELSTVIGARAHIRANSVIYAGVTIGDDLQTGPNILIRENNQLGNRVCIWANAVLNPENRVGNNVRIHVGCFLEKTTIGNDVFFGPRVTFSDDPHPVMPPDHEECWGGATLADGVIVGAGVIFLPHVQIGTAAFIGAGSVVTKDIPAFAVAYGNPARVHYQIDEIVCTRTGTPHRPYQQKKETYENSLR